MSGSSARLPSAVPDRAGFIVNALLLPYLNHAARLLETGFASREDIDAAATAGLGLPMGPLALLDLIGLDTSLSILEVLACRVRRIALHGRAGAAAAGRGGPDRAQGRPRVLRLPTAGTAAAAWSCQWP